MSYSSGGAGGSIDSGGSASGFSNNRGCPAASRSGERTVCCQSMMLVTLYDLGHKDIARSEISGVQSVLEGGYSEIVIITYQDDGE